MGRYKVVAIRTNKSYQESNRVAIRDGVKYKVEGTVLIYGTPRNIGAYIGDARVERVIKHAGELLTKGESRIEIIVTEHRISKRV